MGHLLINRGTDGNQAVEKVWPVGNARRVMGTVLFGLFVTTLAQPLGLGELPLRFLLKNRLHFLPHAMALFSSIVLIPFYLKPIAGLVSDTLLLKGTRHRYYLLLGSLSASSSWVLIGFLPHTYGIILVLSLMVSTALMVSGTVIGALLVGQAKQYGMTGRYSALRVLIMGVAAAIAGGVGSFMALRPLLLTCLVAGILCLLLLGVTYRFIREEPIMLARSIGPALREHVETLLRSRNVRILVAILALVLIAPGFNTLLFYLQVDHLRFTPSFIGLLTVLSGVAAIVGSAFYFYLCQFVRLRFLLLMSLLSHVVVTLLYVEYSSPTAALFIQTGSSLVNVLALLAVFDAATRAVPSGIEATGYAVFISIGNLMYALSDLSGSYLHDHFHVQFSLLVLLNAGTTIFAIPLLRLMPARFLDASDGKALIKASGL